METSLFSFDLPANLIAQYPPVQRGTSRLMVLNRRQRTLRHELVTRLPDLLTPGSLVVLNDSRVRKARLYGAVEDSIAAGITTNAEQREPGQTTPKGVEFLLLQEETPGVWRVLVNKARKQKPGKCFLFPENRQGVIEGEAAGLKLLRITPAIDEAYLERNGHVPLPPYIRRGDQSLDEERYQTIYARNNGSAAAPTAGLHFTNTLLEALKQRGLELMMITLHVGLGTFLPIRTAKVEEHSMHTEEFHISGEVAGRLEQALSEKRGIIAVGTTTVRTLESAYRVDLTGKGKIQTGWQKTNIFIYPGYEFKVISEMFTNFHTPASSLLLLVSAFAGVEFVKEAYQTAIGEQYHFFSYGDAMLIQ